MIKRVFNNKPEGTMKVGRQRLRWEECVAGHQNCGRKKLEECGIE
jgi:hypothetical protein